MLISSSIKYVGVNDKKIELFEGQYKVPNGMSYNSYVIIDEKIAVMDTVDAAFTHEWLDNLSDALGGRKPDYLVVQHMEPDHSANVHNFIKTYPNATVVSSEKAFKMMKNFFGTDFSEKRIVVNEGDTLSLGKHTLTFVTAPMVHWPEVIVTYDSVFPISKTDKKALEKIIEDGITESNKDKMVAVLKEGLPNSFAILSNLDKHDIIDGEIKIEFRKNLIENLKLMNHLQLGIFIDKVLMMSKEFKIRFFRNEEYSLHEINGVISKSLGLTLVFEVFKKGEYKTFMEIPFEHTDKNLMIEVLNAQCVRYLYILKIISEVVLATEKDKLKGTKINKNIREQIDDYVKLIKKERKYVKKTGAVPKQTWTYSICGLTDISIEDDDEFFDWEDDDE